MTIRAVRDEIGSRAGRVGSELRERGGDALRRVGALTRGDGDGLAQGLGWFSVALGLAQVTAPETMARLVGVRDDDDNVATMRACGVREIASGVGILTTDDPTSLMWGRVTGDIMDLALLGIASRSPAARKDRLTTAALSVVGVALLDVLSAQRLSRSQGMRPARVSSGRRSSSLRGEGVLARLPHGGEAGIHVTHVITVNKPVDEVYRFWHDFQNLASFMSHLESVEVHGAGRSLWKAKAPAGMTVSWEAETTEDRPNELIAWRSLPGADVDNSGSVSFKAAPAGRGTEVRVELSYRPPAGALGALVAKLFGEAPEQQIKGDLRRFKQVMETGEVVHSNASIHRGMHPAH